MIAIRREYPTASVPLILRTLEDQGTIERGSVKPAAIRRLLAANGLGRKNLARSGKRERRRWQCERPGQLWHGDVCHGPALTVNGRHIPLRIHALMDDASRHIVAISARSSEREVDMLDIFTHALREHGKPEGLYLDNGATYRGEALALACARLSIGLVHATPYDPQARGKMERFWRTLREGCLDFLGKVGSLHDVQVRLLAFIDVHYHQAPHAGLMGRTPASRWLERQRNELSDEELREALTVRERRQVRDDGTISIGGVDWEVTAGWLSSKKVVIARTFAQPDAAPWVEHDEQRLALQMVDPVANSRRKRQNNRPKRGVDAVDFDPNQPRVDRVLGRTSGGDQ